ncbi:MAG: hypothetical protein JW751_16255 [Polyangiaceae bacterium]|nr:hypothetical protein [Polyangiaceae bacterium]
MAEEKIGVMRWWTVAAVLGSTLALAACSDDDDTPRSTAGGAAGTAGAGRGGETGGSDGTAGGGASEDTAGGHAGGSAGSGARGPMGGGAGDGTSGTAPGGATGSVTGGAAGRDGGEGGEGGAGERRSIEPLPFSVMGVWVDDYGGQHRVTETVWTQSGFGDRSGFEIVDYDEAAMFAIAQNDVGNSYNPELWSRFDWTEYGGSLWYCQTTYGATTEAAARDTPRADDTDPSRGGCSGFAWSRLIPPEVVGTYMDNYGGDHYVDAYRWVQGTDSSTSLFVLTQFDNDDDFVVAQNDGENAWNAGLWSRFDWTEHNGNLYFCQTAYAAASEADALATPAADATDPATSGCGSFAWTQLIEP